LSDDRISAVGGFSLDGAFAPASLAPPIVAVGAVLWVEDGSAAITPPDADPVISSIIIVKLCRPRRTGS
jgi:hypothetical protein